MKKKICDRVICIDTLIMQNTTKNIEIWLHEITCMHQG